MPIRTFSLMATKFMRRLRPTEVWNRSALRVPLCTSFITMTWTGSWLYKEVLPLPWIQFISLTVIMLVTLLSLQTRLKVCNSNRTNYTGAYLVFMSADACLMKCSFSFCQFFSSLMVIQTKVSQRFVCIIFVDSPHNSNEDHVKLDFPVSLSV